MQIQPRIGFSAQSPFSPRNLTALWGWFDANSVTLDGNGRVETWKSLAGTGGDITQSDTAKRPNFGTVDGTATIQFNPNAVSDTEHILPSAGPSGATGQTVTFVGKIVSGSGSFYQWATGAEIKANNSEPDWRWANNESASEIQLVRSGPRFSGNSLGIGSEMDSAHGMFVRDDGKKLYLSDIGSETVYQYTLSTSWDISTASFDNKSINVGLNARGLYFKPDGTKMFVLGRSSFTVSQFTLSTPWDVTSASFDNAVVDISSETSIPNAMVMSPDGLKVYVGDIGPNFIYQYDLSIAWDVASSSFNNKVLDASNEMNKVGGNFISPDGKKFFVTGDALIAQYTLSTPFDISSASFNGVIFDASNAGSRFSAMSIKDGGSRLYTTDLNTNEVLQFDIINSWDVSSGNFDTLSLVYVGDTQTKVYINGQFVKDFDPADSNIQGNTPDFIANNGEADFHLRAFTVHEAVLSEGQISQLHNYMINQWT